MRLLLAGTLLRATAVEAFITEIMYVKVSYSTFNTLKTTLEVYAKLLRQGSRRARL